MRSDDSHQSTSLSAATENLKITQRERSLLARAPNVSQDGEFVRSGAVSRDTAAAMLLSLEISDALEYDALLAEEEASESAALQRATEKADPQQE